MSGALIWTSRRVGAVREWGQLGFRVRKKGKDMERFWTLGQLVTDKPEPSDRGLHAPVRLPWVKESSDTGVMNFDAVAQ